MIASGRATLHNWLDSAAVTASAVCTVHCLLLPLLFAGFPAMSQWLNLGERFHAAMLAFALPVSLWALVSGWRQRRDSAMLMTGGIGLCLMAGALLVNREMTEAALTVVGSTLLAAAHVRNWAHRRSACRGDG